MKLILSSSNIDKIKEIQDIIGEKYQVVLKSDVGLEDFDVEEIGKTLKENAYIKAKALYDLVKDNVIADDTGLFVDALDGAPGIYSARYSGEEASYKKNNEKLLYELRHLENLKDRTARFITVICFINKNGEVYYTEGILEGYIGFYPKGENGFGYNPLFIIKDVNKTLAQLTDKERLVINHRRKALDQLKNILERVNL